ncbi:hypothetical protein WBP07_24730 [Novosphingobium sp. BL-8A]|uniref:hypothetical protein n=1 Tax=Novosphingobium sp. BL-8A TaxID=3127639 RepID=UPI0037575338
MTELHRADRFAADRTDNPYWNENVWFSLSIPEKRLHGIIQYCFRHNMGLQIGGPILWDPSGRYQWNCLHYGWSHLQAIPADASKYDVTLRNSLSVKVLVPMQSYRIRYDKDGTEMDLLWQAVSPAHLMESDDPTQQAAAAFHFEQPGRMTGTIRCNDETFNVDCWSMRDGSSGPYDTEIWPTGGYFWGIGKGASFLALCMGDARETATVGGFLMFDDIPSSIASGKRTVLEYGEHGPSLVSFEATDRAGRSIAATGRIDPGLIFTGYTDHTVIWSLLEWDVAGERFWGDNQEFYSAQNFRHIARGEVRLGAA